MAESSETSEPEQTVFIVDDDAAMRNSLRRLLSPVGLKVQAFPSGTAFLEAVDCSASGCVVLDVRMPGMSGLELQERLVARGHRIPVIVITAYADVPMAVSSM